MAYIKLTPRKMILLCNGLQKLKDSQSEVMAAMNKNKIDDPELYLILRETMLDCIDMEKAINTLINLKSNEYQLSNV